MSGEEVSNADRPQCGRPHRRKRTPARSLGACTLATGLVCGCGEIPAPQGASADALPVPAIAYAPRTYIAFQSPERLTIDGRLTEAAWNDAPWTRDFVDIDGEQRPTPRRRTRAKMMWDSVYLYVGAELEEPDLWATLTRRDAVIYQDNDFEIFIDPDGDTHEYYELEINALGTVWDLFLVRPYRDGGPALHAWDIPGLLAAVHHDGTLNVPDDEDVGWSVEVAIPWRVLAEAAHRPTPPAYGDQWRINLSRVQWRLDVADGEYRKTLDTNGAPLAEDNWVWSPQGLVDMHYPEMWGIVQFTGEHRRVGVERFEPDPTARARWTLRQVYYRQRNHFARHGRFAGDPAELGLASDPLDGVPWPLRMWTSPSWFEASFLLSSDTLTIRADGRLR